MSKKRYLVILHDANTSGLVARVFAGGTEEDAKNLACDSYRNTSYAVLGALPAEELLEMLVPPGERMPTPEEVDELEAFVIRSPELLTRAIGKAPLSRLHRQVKIREFVITNYTEVMDHFVRGIVQSLQNPPNFEE